MHLNIVCRRLIQVLFVVLGIAAVLIGSMIFLLGTQRILHLTESSFDVLRGHGEPAVDLVSATLDGELRFYSVYWVSYGALLMWVARDMIVRMRLVPLLAGVFFASGVGRLVSLLSVGPPHPAFVMLMFIELVWPILVVVSYLLYARETRQGLTQ